MTNSCSSQQHGKPLLTVGGGAPAGDDPCGVLEDLASPGKAHGRDPVLQLAQVEGLGQPQEGQVPIHVELAEVRVNDDLRDIPSYSRGQVYLLLWGITYVEAVIIVGSGSYRRGGGMEAVTVGEEVDRGC